MKDKTQNFERSLPDGYKQAFQISAKNIKVGIFMNLAALAVMAVAYLITILPISWFLLPRLAHTDSPFAFVVGIFIGVIAFLPFTVLHELIHGWAYKKKTGEKLTFGVSWSCAHCGVPGIYTYRSTALYALLAPMVVISAVTLIGAAVCATVSLCLSPDAASQEVLVCLLGAFISLFASHIGGCVGDGYMAILFAAKFRDGRTLMRDTGPDQFLYLPDTERAERDGESEN